MTISFFVQDRDRFVPTLHGRGPWSADALHGGPPSALLARAIERFEPEPDLAVARITIELLRPVPLRPLTVRVEMVRPGRTAQRVGASLWDEDREVARALALRIRRSELPGLSESVVDDPPGPPSGAAPFAFPFFEVDVGYHTSVELRLERGEFWKTATRMWMRARGTLVADELLTPLQRLMICADSGNGVSPILDTARYTFVNPDLDVHVIREPRGEWICLEARTFVEPHGIGMADTRLWDESGVLGRAVQMLVVRER